MPLTWKVDHEARLIFTTASGSLQRKDVADYLAAVVVEGAVGYRVMFDARAAAVELRPADLLAFSETVKDRKSDVSSDILLALVGLILLFMAVTEWVRARRSARPLYLSPGLAETIGASPAATDESRPAQPSVGTG